MMSVNRKAESQNIPTQEDRYRSSIDLPEKNFLAAEIDFFGKPAPAAERSYSMHPDPTHHDEFLRNFLSNHDALAGYLRSLLFSDDEVREVMQDVAAVLWRKFTPGIEPEAFRRWAFGTARLEALAFRRSRARDRHVFGEQVFALLEASAIAAAEEPTPRREALRRCLAKLPVKHRELVTAAYTPGVRIDELAASLGRTAMAVYKALHRIRLTLHECVTRTLTTEELA